MSDPVFSIIIPTRDRPGPLAACLQAISRLDYPNDRYEVIVVDDGSMVPVEMPKDGVPDDVQFTLLHQTNAGPASARNRGAQLARGDVLAFTDDDCIPDRQWLRELARCVNRVPGAIIGGRVINGLVNNPYSTASQIIVDQAYAFFHERNSDLRFFASNNMAVNAKLFNEWGSFDPSFRCSEDRDLCSRWIRHGGSLVFAPKAIVLHHHNLSFTSFCRQHFYYGRGACQFSRKRAQWGGSFIKPSLRFYADVMLKALFAPTARWRFGMVGLMGVWQVANLAGFLSQVFSRGPESRL